MGWTGVPKAGDEEGIGLERAGVGPLRNKGAVRAGLFDLSIIGSLALDDAETLSLL